MKFEKILSSSFVLDYSKCSTLLITIYQFFIRVRIMRWDFSNIF